MTVLAAPEASKYYNLFYLNCVDGGGGKCRY